MTGGLFRITHKNAFDYLAQILEIEFLSFVTPWSPLVFCDELRDRASGVWGYAEQGRLWGYVCYKFAGRDVRVQNIAVHPRRRNRGIGTLLLRQAERAAWAGGFGGVFLEVRTSNQPARRLYSRCGFEEAGRSHGYYRDTGEDAILMRLKIPDRRARDANGCHQPRSRGIHISTHSSLEV